MMSQDLDTEIAHALMLTLFKKYDNEKFSIIKELDALTGLSIEFCENIVIDFADAFGVELK